MYFVEVLGIEGKLKGHGEAYAICTACEGQVEWETPRVAPGPDCWALKPSNPPVEVPQPLPLHPPEAEFCTFKVKVMREEFGPNPTIGHCTVTHPYGGEPVVISTPLDGCKTASLRCRIGTFPVMPPPPLLREKNQTVRVLSVDGGGIRGIIPGFVLSFLERVTKTPLLDLFDVFVGTSTGGILAGGATHKHSNKPTTFSAAELTDMYVIRGSDIFHDEHLGVSQPKYRRANLDKVIDSVCGQDILATALKPTIITTFDMYKNKVQFFESWDENARQLPKSFVLACTSAAPTFFAPPVLPKAVPNKYKKGVFVDGGVAANNPALVGFTKAKELYPHARQIIVISLGCGQPHHKDKLTRDEVAGWGLLRWGMTVSNVFMDSASQIADSHMQELLGPPEGEWDRSFYKRYQIELHDASAEMDNASKRNIAALLREGFRLVQMQEESLLHLAKLLKQLQPPKSPV